MPPTASAAFALLPACATAASSKPGASPEPQSKPTTRRARTLSRRAALQSLALLALAPSSPANAVCGEPDPYSAHYLPWDDDLVELPDGRGLHVRVVGKRKGRGKGKLPPPPLLVLLDAGASLSAGEPLELLAVSRRVVQADYFGVADSTRLPTAPATRAAALDALEAEAVSALGALGPSPPHRIHVFAAGLGIAAARRLAQQGRVASAVVEGWAPVRRDASLADLLGDRVCAVEAAAQGDPAVARIADAPNGFVHDLHGLLAAGVPTLALRVAGAPPLPETPGLRQVSVRGGGRLAHLADTEGVLEEVERFLSAVDKDLGVRV